MNSVVLIRVIGCVEVQICLVFILRLTADAKGVQFIFMTVALLIRSNSLSQIFLLAMLGLLEHLCGARMGLNIVVCIDNSQWVYELFATGELSLDS